MRLVDDGKTAVRLANPKTIEYQIVRTSLLPGCLKTVNSNRHHPLPLRIFEVSEVVFKDPHQDSGARNERHVACIFMAKSSAFEVVHGLLHHLMAMLRAPLVPVTSRDVFGYSIRETANPSYFPGRCAAIDLHDKGKVRQIGVFGILHPDVLKAYDVDFPCTAMEFQLSPFL